MILKTEKLDVGYGKKKVVHDVEIKALKGQFVCLLGPNGCGKSTIIKSLIKMLSPIDGAVYIKGKEINKYDNKELSKTVAVVLTDRITPGLLTVRDIVALGRHPYTNFIGKADKEDDTKIDEALKIVNAIELSERYFSELSDGEKQKVMLARALAQEPKLIVLDEPTSHLDARHRIEVMLILRNLTKQKGVTIIASIHDIDLAMKACDSAILVKDNAILAAGPPEDVLRDENVAHLYDMKKASFSGFLGGIELHSSNRGPIFIVPGSGSGSSVFRSFAKNDYEIITGILHKNDIDYHIASTIGATIIGERPYCDISPKTLVQASEVLKNATQVVDTGFPIGSSNLRNLELTFEAIDKGKIVHSLRSPEEIQNLFAERAKHIIAHDNISNLITKVGQIDQVMRCAGAINN